MGRPEKIRLGDILVGQKVISQENLGAALAQQKRSGRKLGRVLVEMGFVSDDQICEAIARQLNIPFVNLKFFNTSPEVVRMAKAISPLLAAGLTKSSWPGLMARRSMPASDTVESPVTGATNSRS